METFSIIEPTAPKVPIIISSPHSGTYFPDDIKKRLKPGLAERPDDADWFIGRLYDFAPAMGITLIKANYCRWVIDLNRDPKSKPLYDDGRVITGLCPVTDFNGNPLYEYGAPNDAEIKQRVEEYYIPYHLKLAQLTQEMKQEFGKALLFDAHSIRRVVPGIRPEPFPDLILGDNDGASAWPQVIDTAWQALQGHGYGAQHNHPFKGGYITRFFGQPQNRVHALQLEMAKTNYMDASETEYDEANAARIRAVLQNLFAQLIKVLEE